MTCPVCGSPFEDRSTNHIKRYCSTRCKRQVLYVRKRYGPDEPVEPHRRKRESICSGDCFHCEYPDCVK